MAQLPDNPDPLAWRRYFAMECNNRAWQLSVEPRDILKDREMLNAAHGAAWHWEVVGTDLNRMRATTLLAEVHALLGHGATALAYAREMRDYFLTKGNAPDWEVALTHAVYAHAAYAAGELAAYRAAYQSAATAIAAISDEEDRAIVLKTFKQVTVP
jgi:hypothetical protein